MRPSYTDDYIEILVACDVENYQGNIEDMEDILTERFNRDLRRRADWTAGMDREAAGAYRREISRQVAELDREYGFNTNYEPRI